MGKKKKKYVPEPYESMYMKKDTSANIYASMMISDSFNDLSKAQKVLYMYCKLQRYGQKSSKKPDGEASFVFNKAMWCDTYRLYTDANSKQFYKDMDELQLHGFIECVSGKNTRQKNHYYYSNLWQKWGTPQFCLKLNRLSSSARRKFEKTKNCTEPEKQQGN